MPPVQEFDPKQVKPSDAVTLTETAIRYIKKQISKRGQGIGVRLTTKKSGCAGFAYVIDIIDHVDPTDMQFSAADLIVVVSPEDFSIVKGTVLDYERQGLNARMVFRNPNEAGSCGCGESFSVKNSTEPTNPTS